MKPILLAFVFCISFQLLFSQENSDNNTVKMSLNTIIKDSRIDQLEKTYSSSYTLKGYRVQIHSGNKKQPANQARSIFLRVHPKTKAHLDYEQPYYRVRVGDFKTKLEALKYKNFIAKEFPNCFIVNDKIDINELID